MGGSGTIEKALKGGDVKEGIRYYKFLFEAIYRIKLDACGIDNNLENSPDVSRLLDRIDEAANDLNFEVIETILNFEQLNFLPNIPGDMAMWMDSFLEMVDLLMNIIYCLRTGNWNGYLEAIYMFLPYCFSLNKQNYSKLFKKFELLLC